MATETEARRELSTVLNADPAIGQWRGLKRAATVVALLTSPAAFLWFHEAQGWSVGISILATLGEVVLFRAALDLVLRAFIPWPSLSGTDADERRVDTVDRRRAWFWRTAIWRVAVIGLIAAFLIHFLGSQSLTLILQLLILLPANFLIFFGPFLLMAVRQISSYEPGDADWGVKLDDVRGQAEAKEEVRRS